jgi:hypothetical protein
MSLWSAEYEEQDYSFESASLLFNASVASIAAVVAFLLLLVIRTKGFLGRNKACPAYDIFSEVLPAELTELSWAQRFLVKLREVSIIGGILYSESNKLRYMLKCVFLVLTVMFVDMLIAVKLYNDDGYCHSLSSEDSCLSVKSRIIGNWQNTCRWNDVDMWCSFELSHNDFVSVIILSVTVLLSSLPILFLINICIDTMTDNMEMLHDHIGRKSYTKVFVDDFRDQEKGVVTKGISNTWQNLKSKISIAGRIDILRRGMDLVTVDDEVSRMGVAQKQIKSRKIEIFINALSWVTSFFKNKSLPQGGVGVKSIPGAVAREVLSARTRALDINSNMDSVLDDRSKELMLFRHFLVYSLSAPKHQFARRYLCNSSLSRSAKLPSEGTLRFCQLLLLVYSVVLVVILFSKGQDLNSGSVYLWVTVAVIAVVLYIFLVETSFTFIVYIIGTVLIRGDVLRMRDRLRDLGRLIVRRPLVVPAWSKEYNMIQHFNPACRVARIRPKYLISRILVQLNDLDIPSTFIAHPPYSSEFALALTSLLSSMPVFANDLCLKGILVIFWGGSIVACFNLWIISVPLLVLFLIVLVYAGLFIFYKAKKANKTALKLISKRPREKRSSFADALVESGYSREEPPHCVSNGKQRLGRISVHPVKEEAVVKVHHPLPSVSLSSSVPMSNSGKPCLLQHHATPIKLSPLESPSVFSPHSQFKVNKLPQIEPRDSPLKKQFPPVPSSKSSTSIFAFDIVNGKNLRVPSQLSSEMDNFRKKIGLEIESLKKENSSLK